MRPRVSAIIPTYSRGDFILRAIKSVLNQKYENIEIIVIDDHSPVPVREIISKSDIDIGEIIVERHSKNKGGNAARNTGIRKATGDYIAFLDDDDKWHKDKIERQIRRISETESGVVYTGVRQIDHGTTVATKTGEISGDITCDLFHRNFIGTFSSILVDKDIISEVGYLDEGFPSWQDWDYYLRLSYQTTFEAIPDPLVDRHNDGQTQISDDYHKKNEVSSNRLLKKHRDKAKEYGAADKFLSGIHEELGWAAIRVGEYGRARQHLLNSIQYNISTRSLLLLILTIGDGFVFRTLQNIKRKTVSKVDS